ncbi:CLAVATA3/ESR (CLE)-related protein 1 [Rhodamnia argentea]|uniref:CLAVATA3/ESR (CLE)-related protein 1 n=1 Tax=Rhodamnia argentea TaxID=178133 RepID=A0A8B8NTW6_9MYRT|nr:CLAVATA3/ESR (CLE)-related protein 1 [Rhodamnia argentea]
MASLRFWLCLVMFLLVVSRNEARTPKALPNDGGSAMMESAKQVLKGFMQKKEETDSKRVAPGGPDPHHH